MLAFIVGCAVVYGIIPHLDAVSDPVTNKIPLADRVAYNGLHRWVTQLQTIIFYVSQLLKY